MSVNAGRRGIQLVQPQHSKTQFHVGEAIPSTGIYRAFHSLHRVSHEVTLLRGEVFPPCNRCGNEVHFELERLVPGIDEDGGFKVRLYQIPHPPEDKAA